MIIVEGPENSGKSTLAEDIRVHTGGTLVHNTNPPASPHACIARAMEQMKAPNHTIFDRVTIISEQVYGPLLRDENFLGETAHWNEDLAARNPLIIYCRPPIHHIRTLTQEDFRPEEDPDHVQKVMRRTAKIIHRYDYIMSQYRCLYYDYTHVSPEHHRTVLRLCEHYI